MLINLKKNQVNEIVVTLTELTTISAPIFYLFVFEHETQGQKKAIILEDVSAYPKRYNKFILTLPTDLALDVEGDYKYKIYAQNSAINLDEELADQVVQMGKAVIYLQNANEYYYQP